jgi:FtsP/CotA-like multicopper oxidase with cupredoxin domain
VRSLLSRTITRRLALKALGTPALALGAVTLGPLRTAGAEPQPIVLTATKGASGLAFESSGSGAEIRVRRGAELLVRVVNALGEPTAVHWHGARIRNAADGVVGLTQDAIAPGQSFDYRFVARDAGTFWYHPAAASGLSAQAEAGLWGVLVVEESDPPEVDRDIVLAVRAGAAAEVLALAQNERIRLRLVNVSTTRIASLAFAGFEPFIVALDGQPANQPFLPARSRLDLAPGGRADILLDGTLATGARAGIAMLRDGEVAEIVRLTRADAPSRRPNRLPEPAALPGNGLAEDVPLGAATRFDLKLGVPRSLADPPLFKVAEGQVVSLGLINDGEAIKAVHLHGHVVRVLHPFDDGWEPYWLDTVLVNPGETVRVAFVADNPGKWAVTAQTVEHPDEVLATSFEVGG